MKSRWRMSVVLLAVGCAAGVGSAAAATPNFNQTTITGDWGGARQRLYDSGVNFTFGYLNEFAANTSGGTRHTQSYADQLALGVDLDFGRMFGWTGGAFHFLMTDRNGRQLDEKAGTGALLETQEIFGGGDYARIVRFYFEQQFGGGLVDVKLGRMDIGAAFYPFACDFQNLGLCGPLPAWIANGVNGFPFAQDGIVVRLDPHPVYFQVGAFKVNPDNLEKSSALRIWPHGHSTGTLTMAEAGWAGAIAGNRTFQGTWAVGGWHNSAKYPDVASEVDPVDSLDTENVMRHSPTGFYLTGTQQVMDDGAGHALSLFTNVVNADSKVAHVDQLIDVGLMYTGPFASRPDDRVAFAIGRARVSHRLTTATRVALGPDGDAGLVPHSEYVYELNYSLQLYHGLSLMPGVQYIHDPGGIRRNNDVTVLGVQLTAAF